MIVLTSQSVDAIYPDLEQPRKDFNDKEIISLAWSILAESLINPIEVTPKLQLITGERRWRAVKLLHYQPAMFLTERQLTLSQPEQDEITAKIRHQWANIPANVNDAKFTKYEKLRHQLAENVSRAGGSSGMNPIETAHAYADLYRMKTGKDWDINKQNLFEANLILREIANEVGVSSTVLKVALSLLDEPDFVLKDVAAGRPASYYKLVNSSTKYKGLRTLNKTEQLAMKKKIAGGGYQTKANIVSDLKMLKEDSSLLPLITKIDRGIESSSINILLNGITRLGLALSRQKIDEINPKERKIVKNQLAWVQAKIGEFLDG